MSPNKKLDGNRPFDPEEMQKRVNRLQREGKMPSLQQFLNALMTRDDLLRLPKQARLDLLTQMTLERLVAEASEPVQKVVSIEKGKNFRKAFESHEGNHDGI
jgi:hypothetical protein